MCSCGLQPGRKKGWGAPDLPQCYLRERSRRLILLPLIASFMIWTKSYREGYLSLGQQVHRIPVIIASSSRPPCDFRLNLNTFKLLQLQPVSRSCIQGCQVVSFFSPPRLQQGFSFSFFIPGPVVKRLPRHDVWLSSSREVRGVIGRVKTKPLICLGLSKAEARPVSPDSMG